MTRPSKTTFAVVGLIGYVAVCIAMWAIYNKLGEPLTQNMSLVTLAGIVILRASMIRYPSFKHRYYASLRNNAAMKPKMRSVMVLLSVPCIVGLFIAGWWVCAVISALTLAHYEYDFRVLMADHSVNTAA